MSHSENEPSKIIDLELSKRRRFRWFSRWIDNIDRSIMSVGIGNADRIDPEDNIRDIFPNVKDATERFNFPTLIQSIP